MQLNHESLRAEGEKRGGLGTAQYVQNRGPIGRTDGTIETQKITGSAPRSRRENLVRKVFFHSIRGYKTSRDNFHNQESQGSQGGSRPTAQMTISSTSIHAILIFFFLARIHILFGYER